MKRLALLVAALWLAMAPHAFAQGTHVYDLPALPSPLVGSEPFWAAQNNVTKKVTTTQIITSIATATNTAVISASQFMAGPLPGGGSGPYRFRSIVVGDLPFTLTPGSSVVATTKGSFVANHCLSAGDTGGSPQDSGVLCGTGG